MKNEKQTAELEEMLWDFYRALNGHSHINNWVSNQEQETSASEIIRGKAKKFASQSKQSFSEREIVHFLEWMNKVTMETPMRLETDNEDIAAMYLSESKLQTKPEKESQTVELNDVQINNLLIEINHILDSGVNDIRLIEMFKMFWKRNANKPKEDLSDIKFNVIETLKEYGVSNELITVIKSRF